MSRSFSYEKSFGDELFDDSLFIRLGSPPDFLPIKSAKERDYADVFNGLF
jgi:hypothetical protein